MTARSIATISKRLKKEGKKIVATNGCFDLLHAGHVSLLAKAKSFGDVLIVGLNSDESVRKLKGAGRPINTCEHRLRVLQELRSVDFVCIFTGTTAVDFLKAADPDVWVKGGDWTMETLDVDELSMVHGEVRIIPIEVQTSTTKTIERATAK